LVALPLSVEVSWRDRLRVEEQFHGLTSGGHLAVIPLDDDSQDPYDLISVTRDSVAKYRVGFYAYNRRFGYCAGCQKIFYGALEKCPVCGSVNLLQSFSRI
jgi:ribonucleoside-triphosphate reductase